MKTPSGLIEFANGWIVGVTAPAPGMVMLQLQFDPRREFPAHGIKQIRCSTDEASELEEALAVAISRASLRPIERETTE